MKNPKKKIGTAAWIVFLVGFFAFLYVFNTTLDYQKPGDYQDGIVYEKARVIEVEKEDMGPDPDYDFIQIGKQWLKLEILTGEFAGRSTTAINYVQRVNNKPASMGTELVISSFDGFVTTSVVNYSRENYLYLLLALFLAVVLLFGRKKGLKSIASLAFTILCVLFLFLPMIIKGVEPILAAVVVVVLSTAVTLLALNGFCKKTVIAAVSCSVCTMFAGVIAYATGAISHISTLNESEAELLLFISDSTALRVKDLLFAGILIAALGAVMDTAMSIASSLTEMKSIDPTLTQKQLWRSGMNVGKDIMGTMTNTLILAFTGSSLNILLVYYMYSLPYIALINLDLLVVEVIRGLSGSIAVILAIPVTTLIASRALHGTSPSGKDRQRKALAAENRNSSAHR